METPSGVNISIERPVSELGLIVATSNVGNAAGAAAAGAGLAPACPLEGAAPATRHTPASSIAGSLQFLATLEFIFLIHLSGGVTVR